MRALPLILGLAVALAGCQTDGDGLTAAASPAAENPLQTGAPGRAERAAPAVVEVESADAIVEAVRDVEADIVLVNFWATWCGPCRVEFPDLVRYDAENDEGVEVRFVSVDLKPDSPLVQQFLDDHAVEDPSFLYTGPGELIGQFDEVVAGQLPVTLVFDGDGKLLKSHLGLLTYSKIDQLVADARSA